jgi:hypothetical protein
MGKKIIITVEDESGNMVSKKEYPLNADTNNLSKIEANVEGLRSEMLSDVTKSLLTIEQNAHKKKLH